MTARFCRVLLQVAVWLGFLWSPVRADAYVCTRAEINDGPSLWWRDRTITFALSVPGTSDIASDEELDVLRQAFGVWEQATLNGETTDVSFVERSAVSHKKLGYDFSDPSNNENVMMFRDEGWVHTGQAGILALTTSTFSSATGEILDADIEYNSGRFDFTVGDDVVVSDLLNTAVHEVGHLLGFAHSPNSTSTMQASAQAGETDKRDLSDEDMAGMLFKYPTGEDNGYCEGLVNASCGFCEGHDLITQIPVVTVLAEGDGLDDGVVCQ